MEMIKKKKIAIIVRKSLVFLMFQQELYLLGKSIWQDEGNMLKNSS